MDAKVAVRDSDTHCTSAMQIKAANLLAWTMGVASEGSLTRVSKFQNSCNRSQGLRWAEAEHGDIHSLPIVVVLTTVENW